MTFIKNKLRATRYFIQDHWKILLFVVALVIIGAVVWQRRQQAAQPVLTFTQPEYRDLTATLEVSGVVDAKEKASLRFAMGGKVVAIRAKEGDAVIRGQTIAVIDQAELQKRLQLDLNSYMRERYDWEQTLDNTQDRAIPTDEARGVEQSQLTLNDTVLNVQIRDIAIRNTVLSAPFAGILIKSPVTTPGINLLATDTFDIVNPETLIFKAAVDEADIAKVKAGQSAIINLDAYPDSDIASSVAFIGFTSQQSTSGTVFLVELPLQSEGALSRYRLGMNGDVSVILDKRSQVLSIPLDATRQRDDKTFVDVKTSDTTFEERQIEVGLETEEYIQVISGLEENEEIVLPS
ncbi:MAG: efflux RND transporter periplasmic adaptor subunit [bacterium]|nr:efflux RND transporter periplasmic adaptor subunit [bacterium]